MMYVRALANEMLAGPNSVVLGFAEQPTGEGKSLIIQFPLEQEDEEEGGLSGYCVSTETGATHYGGIQRISVHAARRTVDLTLTPEAANELGLQRMLEFQIVEPVPNEADFYESLRRLASLAGIDVEMSSDNGAGAAGTSTKPPNVSSDRHNSYPLPESHGDSAVTVSISLLPEGLQEFSADVIDRIRGSVDISRFRLRSPERIDVQVRELEECEQIASILASWVATTSSNFWLLMQGPNAKAELRVIRTEHDMAFLFDGIASAGELM